MPEITIRLRIDRESGRKDIVIELSEDADLAQWEHEEAHQAIVEKLLGEGVLSRGEVGDVRVTRVRPDAARAPGEEQSCDPHHDPERQRAGE